MDSIFIEAGQDTPSIILNKDSSTFIVSHRSYPEDPIDFYQPILSWIQRYIQQPNDNTIFEFKLDYFNTNSSKQIFKMMLLLEQLSKSSRVLIRWHYKKSDKEMHNHGEIFSKIINVPFELIEY